MNAWKRRIIIVIGAAVLIGLHLLVFERMPNTIFTILIALGVELGFYVFADVIDPRSK